MISLKAACKKVLKLHPKEYIHCVNDYKDAYQFILLNNGEDITEVTWILETPGVIKETGEVLNDACMFDKIFEGDFKQYTKSDIERL